MATKYAEGTTVSAYKTMEEIQKLLRAKGCDEYGQLTQNNCAMVLFRHDGIPYRIMIQLPDIDDKEFRFTPAGRRRTASIQAQEYDQECRRRWRSLLLLIKAKLVAVSDNIITFEDEFLAYAIMGDGQTVGDHAKPLMARAKAGGSLPLALALPSGNSQ